MAKERNLATVRELTVQNLVVSGVGDKAGAVLGPIQVGDKTGMALQGTQGSLRAEERVESGRGDGLSQD